MTTSSSTVALASRLSLASYRQSVGTLLRTSSATLRALSSTNKTENKKAEHLPHVSSDPINDSSLALRIHNLSVRLGNVSALQDISFSVPIGSMFAVVGPNGAGKSSLLHAIVGLIPRSPNASVVVLGKNHKNVSDCARLGIAFLPQRSHIDWHFPITVRELVGMGVVKRWWQPLNRNDHKRIDVMLDLMDLTALSRRRIAHLSGGQQQRAFLARTILQSPQILFLDEPFNGIDAPSVQVLSLILRQFCRDGGTVVCVHHDLKSLNHIFDHALILNQQVWACGKVGDVSSSMILQQAYGLGISINDPSPNP